MIQTVEKTEFHVVVVKLKAPTKHPNADTLDLFDVDGATVISKTGNFKEGDLAVYVPVDSLVPLARPEFEFLRKPGHEADLSHRLRAARLRGIFSMGLLVPVPKEAANYEVGNDVAELLGVLKYVRPSEARLEGVPGVPGPKRKQKGPKLPVYGLDSMRKFKSVLEDGEMVVITEKIHGCNARFFFEKGKLWVGSHKVMRGSTPSPISEFFSRLKLKIMSLFGMKHRAHLLQEAGDVWWQTAKQYGLKEKLAKKPGFVLYGEVYGQNVQDGFFYDSPGGRRFRAFDVMELATGRFLDYDEFLDFIVEIGLHPMHDTVPFIATLPWNEGTHEMVKSRADTGKSTLTPHHMIEGLVVKPYRDRVDNRVGRVALKYVGETYLLKEK